MLIVTGFIMILARDVKPSDRLTHYLTSFVLITATLAYYAMASGSGNLYILKKNISREIFFARYIDWVITTPLILVILSLIIGLPGIEVVKLVFADLVMVFTGLFGALLSDSKYRWGWFVFGCVAELYLIYGLLIKGYRYAKARSDANERGNKLFIQLSAYTLIIWALNPIVWALGNGTSTISVDLEVIMYAILDVAAKGGFAIWLISMVNNYPECRFTMKDDWVDEDAEGNINLSLDDE